VKVLTALGSALVGAALAYFAVAGIVSSQTAAPASNPAHGQIADYGDR
jgi:hypothetical protein